MRRAVCGIACVALALGLAVGRAQADPAPFELPEDAVYEPEVALASVGEGVSCADVAAALAKAGSVADGDIRVEEVCEGVVRVELGDGASVEDAVQGLLDSGVVEDAQPNYCYVAMDGEAPAQEAPALAAASATNDPNLGDQWALRSIGALDAWSVAQANGTVTVAILDLGCDVGHADLRANVVAPYNAYNAVYGGSTTDVTPVSVNHAHGTHVAGIVAGVSNNGIGISGVSYNAHVMPIKVVDAAGNAYSQSLIKAYDYLMQNASKYNVRVVNLSMGAAGQTRSDDAFLRKIDEAYQKGIVTVSCAGNRSAQGSYGFPYDCYPSDYDKVVSVMNLRQQGIGVVLSEESNYNRPGEREKNISAPGTAISSTVPGSDFGTMSGTSMAAPHVSAVLALEFAANPSLGAAEAVDILYGTAKDLGASGWDETYGYGEVNAYEAVRAARAKAAKPSAKWRRLAGTDRYGTMEAIVQEGFGTCPCAVVATGANYPDALAASALAGVLECPVVLTEQGRLSTQARSRLGELGVSSVYLMGGTGTLSEGVEEALAKMGILVTRVAGDDRQATSLRAYEATRALGSGSDTVVVATGHSFADALSIGPWAYATSSPVLLAKADGRLTDAEVRRVRDDAKVRRVLLVGGTGAVSDDVRTQLGGGYEYVRLAGPDRYATSEAIALWETRQGLRWANPGVATGRNFPDALAGAALCGSKSSVLVLVSKASDPTVALVRKHISSVSRGYLLGGTASVPDALAAELG